MGSLYLTEQNAYLRKVSERLRVEKDDQVLLEVPIFKVERVLVFGNVQVTTPALVYLLQQGIDTSYLSLHGHLHGRLVPVENKNIHLRLKQYQTYQDKEFRLRIARELIRSKLTNGRRFLQRLTYSRSLDLSAILEDMQRYARLAELATEPASIRGYEGKGTAAYFQGFSQLVQGFSFTGRHRRPPKDPVNSLLSFGYTLLAGEMFAALSAHGLDPYLGFFHEVKYGRAALCFDLCEEFRHLVVDGMVLDLINRRQIQECDFETDEETQGLWLKPETRKKFLAAFELKLTGVRKGSKEEGLGYRKAIYTQCERLRKAITGAEAFTGYRYS